VGGAEDDDEDDAAETVNCVDAGTDGVGDATDKVRGRYGANRR
jgi:hypothetical protein